MYSYANSKICISSGSVWWVIILLTKGHVILLPCIPGNHWSNVTNFSLNFILGYSCLETVWSSQVLLLWFVRCSRAGLSLELTTPHTEIRPSSVFYPLLCELWIFPFWLVVKHYSCSCVSTPIVPFNPLDVFSPSLRQFPHTHALISTLLNTWRGPSAAPQVLPLWSSLLPKTQPCELSSPWSPWALCSVSITQGICCALLGSPLPAPQPGISLMQKSKLEKS